MDDTFRRRDAIYEKYRAEDPQALDLAMAYITDIDLDLLKEIQPIFVREQYTISAVVSTMLLLIAGQFLENMLNVPPAKRDDLMHRLGRAMSIYVHLAGTAPTAAELMAHLKREEPPSERKH